MHYLLYNPLAKLGKCERSLKKIKKYFSKKKIEIQEYSVIDIDDFKDELLAKIKEDDSIVIIGGDGTLHHLLEVIDFKQVPCSIFMYKAGSGNDYARGHKGKLFEITNEVKDLPYYIANGNKYSFLNGVGMGIDAAVCNEVENGSKKEGYFKTACRVFKSYKPFHLELTIDGEQKEFDNVFFFVVMNGKYIGGGMKIAPKALRSDDHLDVVIIQAKSFKQILPIFPLVFLGWHTIAKKKVTTFTARHVVAKCDGIDILQADGEVQSGIDTLEVFRY